MSKFLTYRSSSSVPSTVGIYGSANNSFVSTCSSYNSTIRGLTDVLIENGVHYSSSFIIPIDCTFNNTFYYSTLPIEISNETTTSYKFDGSFYLVGAVPGGTGTALLSGAYFSSTFNLISWDEKSFTPLPFYKISLITAKKSVGSIFENIALNGLICLGYEVLNNELILKIIDYATVKYTGEVASFDIVSSTDTNKRNSYTITIN